MLLSDNYFMDLALKEAAKAADREEVPIGAVICAGTTLLSKAHNQVEQLGDVTAHAEMIAITSAASALGGKYLHDCTLYVTLEPCTMCATALYWARIGRLVYGAQDDRRGYTTVGRPILHPSTKVAMGVREAECRKLLQDFFRARR